MKTGSIYLIRNKINNKVYIGQTLQPVEVRFNQRLKLLKTNSRQAISKAISKYGRENFTCAVLKTNIRGEELDNE